MLTFLWLACARPQVPENAMSSDPLHEHLAEWAADGRPETIDDLRADAFQSLADWIVEQADAPMIFVCTHNSRRSHMSQLWAQAAADHFRLEHVRTFSGGTEATAFNPRAVNALTAHGFQIAPSGDVIGDANVVYDVTIGDRAEPVRAFSKTFGDDFNPQDGFAAVMTCSAADAACPFVPGADIRAAIPYLDPKTSDGTPEEASTYLAKSEEIGREMVYLMKLAAEQKATADR
ncbi:MAG: protein-tyrosine-phosphatase [Myxococcota bacterium]